MGPTVLYLNCTLQLKNISKYQILYQKIKDVSNLGLVFAEEEFSTSANSHPEVGTYVTLAIYTDVATASLCICGLASELHCMQAN